MQHSLSFIAMSGTQAHYFSTPLQNSVV